jgi:hypothetical protein
VNSTETAINSTETVINSTETAINIIEIAINKKLDISFSDRMFLEMKEFQFVKKVEVPP